MRRFSPDSGTAGASRILPKRARTRSASRGGTASATGRPPAGGAFLSDDEVLLIRQYRYATGGEIYEVPAGTLDPGEDPETCALRELEEETGYRAGRIEKLVTIWTTPGFTDERIHLFMARDLTPGHQRLEDDELIELVPMSLGDALDRVFRGGISDAKSALAILHAARLAGKIRAFE